jgi:hypothetical protein
MKEQFGREEYQDGPEAFADAFEAPPSAGDLVEVTDGLHVRHVPPGQTVGDVRSDLAVALNLDPESQAVLDGEPVADDVVLEAGQSLSFLGPAGEKGAAGLTPRPAASRRS